MKRRAVKLSCLALCASMIFSGLVGCGGGDKNKQNQNTVSNATSSAAAGVSEENSTHMEYSVFLGVTNPISIAENKNDVVTPYVEQKFNIKVKEIIQPQANVLPKDRLNMMIAANSIPDVVIADGAFASYAVSTGNFIDDLSPYISEMTNFNKYFDESKWANFQKDGKIYAIPLQSQTQKTDELFKDDPYYQPFAGWAFWVREDILAKAGYKFTPIAELKKNITDQGKLLTKEDMKIEPAIDTPEQWVEMLKKIKDLNLKVGDKSVIPLSVVSWNQFHMGNMYGLSQFKIGTDNKVSGYLGNPEAKDWYKLLWQLYKDNILDKDFLIQKDDQLQSKVSSGLVAAGMSVPDMNGARQNLKNISADADLRFIPWPKKDADQGSFDVMNGGLYRVIINKNVKDVKRLVKYFDWFYSDEGFDIGTWGPESAGLWEMKDGKKVFKDPELAEAVKLGYTKEGTKGPEYYGLATASSVPGGLMTFNSKAAICAPAPSFNPSDARASYNAPLDIYKVMQTISARNGVNSNGRAAQDDGGENSSAVGTYYWGKFQNDRVGKIFAAKTEEDFEKAWDEQYKIFAKEAKYEEAIADMTKFFEQTLKK